MSTCGTVAGKLLARLEQQLGPLPYTWQSRTSRGGMHFFFEWPNGLRLTRDSSGRLFGPGIDVLGDASYAVHPPSVHATGHVYRWHDEEALRYRPARLPSQSILALERAISKKSEIPKEVSQVKQHGHIMEGSRNNSLFRMAAAWRAGGADEGELLAKLSTVNPIVANRPWKKRNLAKSPAAQQATLLPRQSSTWPACSPKLC